MIGTALSVIIAALGAIGSVFSIASHLKRDSFVHRYSPAHRVLFTASLCLVSIAAGWLATDQISARIPEHGPVTSGPQPRNSPIVAESTVRSAPPPEVQQPRPKQSTRHETTTPRIRIHDDAGNLVPELVLLAQRHLPARVTVEGTLHTTTTLPDGALQGLITAKARLSVTISDAGHLTDAFDLDTRGGGFTPEAAIRQARERLDAELTNRLKEHP
jgi:hypothetical protein